MKELRLYVDTSVIGGCFDEEFGEESRALLGLTQRGAVLLISDLLIEELVRAPEQVRTVLASLSPDRIEHIGNSSESIRMRDAYIRAGVVGPRSLNDAHHVALATIARADILVSWNFKHIVHYEKIRHFNAINLIEGYAPLEIRSPKEVV